MKSGKAPWQPRSKPLPRARRTGPGEKPLGVGQLDAARRLGVSLNRLNEIVLGKRSITADTALRLARFLKTSPQLWMRLQADWDLHQAMRREARKDKSLRNDGLW